MASDEELQQQLEQQRRDVLTGARPHERPVETDSDAAKTRVLRGEREPEAGGVGEERVTPPQQSDGAADTSGGASSDESPDSSGDGGDA